MNKLLIFILCLSMTQAATAQKYFTRTGTIRFHSHTTLEDIKAENRKVVSILDVPTGALEFSLLMKDFDFPNDLMEQHFNETYVESDKFPKATFKGKITDISKVDFSKDGKYTVNYVGKLTIKDVTKEYSGTALLEIKGGKVTATSDLKIKPKEFNIEIPATNAANIAEVIDVTISMDYALKP